MLPELDVKEAKKQYHDLCEIFTSIDPKTPPVNLDRRGFNLQHICLMIAKLRDSLSASVNRHLILLQHRREEGRLR